MTTDYDREQFFEDLSEARGEPGEGGNPIRYIERLLGVSMIPTQFFEPDPSTSHSEYYYNTRTNILYKRKKLKAYYIWHPVNII